MADPLNQTTGLHKSKLWKGDEIYSHSYYEPLPGLGFNIQTVGDLKAALANVPDTTPIGFRVYEHSWLATQRRGDQAHLTIIKAWGSPAPVALLHDGTIRAMPNNPVPVDVAETAEIPPRYRTVRY